MKVFITSVTVAVVTATLMLHHDLRRLDRAVSTCELDVQSSEQTLRSIQSSLAESRTRLDALKAGAY